MQAKIDTEICTQKCGTHNDEEGRDKNRTRKNGREKNQVGLNREKISKTGSTWSMELKSPSRDGENNVSLCVDAGPRSECLRSLIKAFAQERTGDKTSCIL